MPVYEVEDPDTGVTLELEGDSPPTEQELVQIFSQYAPPEPAQPSQAVPAQAEAPQERPQITGGRGIAGQREQQKRYDYKEAIKAQIPAYQGDISQVKEIGASPEFNEPSMQSVKASLAANLMGSDFELAQALQDQIPGTTFARDEDANLIAQFPSGGSYYLNAPGLSGQDLAKFGTRAAAFAVPGGGSLPALAVKAGLTEAALQGTEAGLGGEFNKEDIGLATVAAPVGQAIGQSVIAPAIRQGSNVVKRAFRGGEAGRQNLAAALDDFAEFGGVPSIGQGTGNPIRQGLENLSSRVLGGRPIRAAIERTTSQIQNRVRQIADNLSNVRSDDEAGRIIKQGIVGRGGFVERFQNRSSGLWQRFDDLIDENGVVNVTNTQRVLGDLVSDSEVGQILNNPLLARVRDALNANGGNVPYRELRDLRSIIGAKLGDSSLVSDIPRTQLRRMYGALSEDLRSVAASSGDDAVRALNRANAYTSAGHGRIDDFLESITNKVDLDKVYASVAKGGEGIQRLNAFKRSLRPEEWNAVASNVIRKMGRATSGNQDDVGEVFSVNKFLTDWDKLGRAKSVLFSGSPELNAYRENLNRIASAANRFKQAASEMANPSGTGQFVTNVGGIAAAAGPLAVGNVGPLAVVLTAVGMNNGAARLMTNPRFVRWLARTPGQSALPGHLSKLSTIAAASENKEDIIELLSTIESMSQQNTQQPSAQQNK